MAKIIFILISVSFFSVMAANPLDFATKINGHNIRTADPSAHVWRDGRLYLYVSHDEECQNDFHMKDWHVFSSVDMKQWTSHGAVLSLTDLTWADDYAWAPDAAYKNGKYYLIFPAGTGMKDRKNPANSTKWMGIGVAVSESPVGPFKDAIGAPLWREPYANDPSLFIDDDGKAWLYFHGRNFDYYVVEMADDLRSIKGKFIKMDMGGYEPKMEGPWVFKRGDLYYFTMPENNQTLSYYTAKSPTGPWQYKGQFMASENASNNHHSIVQHQGQWLLFYHRWLSDKNSQCDKPQRHVAAEFLHFNDDGTIKPVIRTETGIAGFSMKGQSQPSAGRE
jgi:beta-xylosidase